MNKAQQFWDQQAGKFDESEKQFEVTYRDIIAQTKEYLTPNDSVLDFGCATGSKTILLAAEVNQIVGFDFSGEMINMANLKKHKAGVENLSFTQGTIFSEELEPASFDKIIAYGVMHLLEAPGTVIQRIRELLKPGGLFISVTPCFKNKKTFKTGWELMTYRLMKSIGMFPLHLNRFSFFGYEQLITDRNFKIIKAEKLFTGMTSAFTVAQKY